MMPTMNATGTVSIEAYHQMGASGLIGKDTELLYGTIYKKPRKEPLECVLTSELFAIFSAVEAEGYVVRTFGPITCENSEPEPNISVVRGDLDDYLKAHPTTAELAIEVCGGEDQYDRSKLRAYATARVKECWLVLGAQKRIKVFRDPVNGEFRKTFVAGGGSRLASESLSNVTIDLDKLFRR
jgi:Uma2 family endonuclease